MAGVTASSISFSSVDSSLSTLKNCQDYINTGMDVTSVVALDLLQCGCDTDDVDNMESVMLEYSALSRDLNQYIDAVEETIAKLKHHQPSEVPDLKELVHERYSALQRGNTPADLKQTDKYVQYKDQLRDLRKQMGLSPGPADDEGDEGEDEEIAVTQSSANFTCPITQMEMVNPVKNKVCGHTYEREAIERMIENRQQKGKSARCPKIGCDHSNMNISDLVPDNALKRSIDIHNKKLGRP